MDVEEPSGNEGCQYWMNLYNELKEKEVKHQREIKMVWGHYEQMKNYAESTQKENNILRSKIDWMSKHLETSEKRIERLEKNTNIRKGNFRETDEEISKYKKQRLEPSTGNKRRATEDVQIDALLLSTYKEDGIMESTREIRKKINMSCPDQWQRCHTVGLNLMKKILNYYTRVEGLILSNEEYMTLKRDINDNDINIQCCSPDDNQNDIVIEKEVLNYIFKGTPLKTTPAFAMFRSLKDLLSIVKGHTVKHDKIDVILNDLTKEQFPLSRYCRTCHGVTKNYEACDMKMSFCDKYCQVHYHYGLF